MQDEEAGDSLTPEQMQDLLAQQGINADEAGSVNLEMVCFELKRIKDELEVLDDKKKALNKIEGDLTQVLVTKMKAEGLTSLKGAFGSATYSVKQYHSIEEWGKLVEFVRVSGHFELFQRRVAETAVKEIVENTGAEVPGLKLFEKDAITFRRNKATKP